MHNVAVNVILQSYEQVFTDKERGNFIPGPRSWADQAEDAKDDSLSHILATPSNELNEHVPPVPNSVIDLETEVVNRGRTCCARFTNNVTDTHAS